MLSRRLPSISASTVSSERGLITALLSFAIAALPLVVAAVDVHPSRKGTVQCWRDDRNQRVCGDAVPPSEARRQRELVDKRGLTKGVLPAQKTAEEAARDAKAQHDLEQAKAYDRYLLQAYLSVADIEKARDERLVSLDARLNLAEKALRDTEATLAELNQRKAAKPEDGDDARLNRKIAEFTAARADNDEGVKRIRGERDKLVEEFDRDIRRFRELRPSAGG